MERSDLVDDDNDFMSRRGILGYIGTGSVGLIVGYYLGTRGFFEDGSNGTPAEDETGSYPRDPPTNDDVKPLRTIEVKMKHL